MGDGSRPRLGARPRIGGEGDVDVFVADEQSDLDIDIERWERLAASVLAAEGVRGNAELSILFLAESEIAALNARFMDTEGPTDVLAFPIDEVDVLAAPGPMSNGPDRAPLDPGDAPLLLGDVVVCPAVAARQAAEHAGRLDDELALLVVHGVLHVLGYDHHDPPEAARMRGRERDLLEALHWQGPAPAAFRQGHQEVP